MEWREGVSLESALGGDIFDKFCRANTLKGILSHYRHLCSVLKILPTHFPHFYPRLKSQLPSWRAEGLWAKLEKRASQKCYEYGRACSVNRVLIIGSGPCGLRCAIEAQLLGAKVVLIEKRDRFSRNNVLHLWPFVITDLKALGAKKFYPKFCAGSIDHISIRQLQCTLLKVALLLGVEVHEGVSFQALVNPTDNQSWRCQTQPPNHPVSHYEFDMVIGADGRRNTLPGFRRKALRAKLAIAITANFINRRTEAEARVKEISGVSYIFNQQFFQELSDATGIDLENIVYYKDDTHYFVMTAKKQSLLDTGVLLHDHQDTEKLLSRENICTESLKTYALQAAIFSTRNQLPNLEFAVNHYGQADVAMFDFTAMYQAENASRVVERKGKRLLMTLVGDSLLEPFWPTGSGCARGFLSSFDACWMLRRWGKGEMGPLEVVAERESIYRMLAQTTPENLNKEHESYTIDPNTRYHNLNLGKVKPFQVETLLDTDGEVVGGGRRRVSADNLFTWLRDQCAEVKDVREVFEGGEVLLAIINSFRPDLLEEYPLTREENVDPVNWAGFKNQLAFDLLEAEYRLEPVMSGWESVHGAVSENFAGCVEYITQVYEIFRGNIPQIWWRAEVERVEHSDNLDAGLQLTQVSSQNRVKTVEKVKAKVPETTSPGPSLKTKGGVEGKISQFPGKAPPRPPPPVKQKPAPKKLESPEEADRRRQEIERNRAERQRRRKQDKIIQTERFLKSMRLLHMNGAPEQDDECKPSMGVKLEGAEGGEMSYLDFGDDSDFSDFTFHLYRQTAPVFQERLKAMEDKLSAREIRTTLGANLRSEADEEAEKNVPGIARDLEGKLKGSGSKSSEVAKKKPKDMLRAIGKIEKTDWNVQLIEKKIAEGKGPSLQKGERDDKVPFWDREEFDGKLKLFKRKLDGGEVEEGKASEKLQLLDQTMKKLERQMKDGSLLEVGQRGSNKVSAITDKLKHQNEKAPIEEAARSPRPVARIPKFEAPKKGVSETCHFCKERVYMIERMTVEGKHFHKNCFRCEYCHTALRVGNYVFDREGHYGDRFFCNAHYNTVWLYGWKKYDEAEFEKWMEYQAKQNLADGMSKDDQWVTRKSSVPNTGQSVKPVESDFREVDKPTMESSDSDTDVTSEDDDDNSLEDDSSEEEGSGSMSDTGSGSDSSGNSLQGEHGTVIRTDVSEPKQVQCSTTDQQPSRVVCQMKDVVVEPVAKVYVPTRPMPWVTAVPKKWEPLNINSDNLASKRSLDLKAKYMLGNGNGSPMGRGATGSVTQQQMGGQGGTTQSQYQSLLDKISEQQKLLQPATPKTGTPGYGQPASTR